MWSIPCDSYSEQINTKGEMLPSEDSSNFNENRETPNTGHNFGNENSSNSRNTENTADFEGSECCHSGNEKSDEQVLGSELVNSVKEKKSEGSIEKVDQCDDYIGNERNHLTANDIDGVTISGNRKSIDQLEDCKPIDLFNESGDVGSNPYGYKLQLNNDNITPTLPNIPIHDPNTTPHSSHSPNQARTPQSLLNNIPSATASQNSFLNCQMMNPQMNPHLMGAPHLIGGHQGHNLGGHGNPYFNAPHGFSADHWLWEQHRQTQQVS